MQFSKTSQEYFGVFVDKFNKCLVKKTPVEQKKQNIISERLFSEIKRADKYIKTKHETHNCLSGFSTKIETVKQLKLPSTYSNDYFPQPIRKYIELNAINQIVYSCEINYRKISLTFFTFKNETDFSIYDQYAKKGFMLIYILSNYSSNDCSKTLNIYIYLTDFERKLPDNNYSVLEPYNANGGFTTTCDKNSEIVVYRKEEWFKVLIHETFHNLGLDFSTMNVREFNSKIKKIFPIDSKFNLYESYCEFWARILNAAFCSYNVINNENDKNTFVQCLDFFIQIERLFSLFQCNKILKFLGLCYKSLYENDKASTIARENLYKEKTNVFAYYIATSFLLDNYINVIIWCNNNNKSLFKFDRTQFTLNSFYELIETSYDRDDFLKNLLCVSNVTNKLKKNKKITTLTSLLNTTRMTVMEFE
ncbi:MAG: hypothetical protein WD512_12315 [Candidatus Paceibacterota bacterium]